MTRKNRSEYFHEGWRNFNNHEIFSGDTIYKCPSCEAGIVYPYHDSSDLAEFYAGIGQNMGHDKEYDPNFSLSLSPRLDVSDTKSQRHISSYILAATFRNFTSEENLLEIGAGYGKGFTVADAIYPDMNYYAIEPDKTAVQALRSIDVTVSEGRFTREAVADLGQENFEMIVMNSVLDHLRADEIQDSLRLVQDSLSDDGIFVCIVTNYLGTDFSRQPPNLTHTTLFSDQSLRTACEESGLEVDFLKTNGIHIDKRKRATSSESPMYKNIYNKISPLLPSAFSDIIEHFHRRLISSTSDDPKSIRNFLEELNSRDYLLYGGDRRHIVAICHPSDKRTAK